MSKPDIFLIILDTMRKSTLYTQIQQTSALSRLAKDGVVYDNAIAPSSWTVPSHASMFTGKYVIEHGVRRYRDEPGVDIFKRVRAQRRMLPEIMQEMGYSTHSFHTNNFLSPGTGFEKGFDTAMNSGPFAEMEKTRKSINEEFGEIAGKSIVRRTINLLKSGRITVPLKILGRLRRLDRYLTKTGFPAVKGGYELVENLKSGDQRKPFFVFMNFMEPHEPYEKPSLTNAATGVWDYPKRAARDLFGIEPFPESVVEHSRKMYDGSVARMDDELRGLLDYLESESLYDESLIIVTSDHGQGLKERSFLGHDKFLFDEFISIPLIIKYPNSLRPPIGDGYQTLVSMKEFIEKWGRGETPGFPSEKMVFSESNGYSLGEISMLTDGILEDSPYNVQLIAVFKDNAKLVLDVTNGNIDEFSIDGEPAKPDENKDKVLDLKTEIEFFAGSEKLKFPEI